MRATWNGAVLAESDGVVEVEGNAYFPLESVNRELLRDSATRTTCSWKGEASYYDVVVNGEVNSDAAFYYPDPKSAADHVRGHIAFWRGVEVENT